VILVDSDEEENRDVDISSVHSGETSEEKLEPIQE